MPSVVTILLYLFWLFAGCALLLRSRQIRLTGIGSYRWLGFYGIKIITGTVYGMWYARQPGSDTWRFHEGALIEYHELWHQPGHYFTGIFREILYKPGGLLQSSGYWNDLRDNLMLKVISLMDVLSGGNYYINVVLYEWFTLWGMVWLVLALTAVAGIKMPWWTWAALCLLPSCLFWTSGIHRDGFVLLLTAGLLYQVTHPSQKLFGRFGLPVMTLTLLFFVRNYMAILLAPGILVYLLAQEFNFRWKNGLILATYGLLVTGICSIPEGRTALLEKQAAFSLLEGRSRMPEFLLEDNPLNFIINIPNSIWRALSYPRLGDQGGILSLVATVEGTMLIIFWALTIAFAWRWRHRAENLSYLLICSSVTCLWVIGITVPFAGALVRYRCIPQLLLTAASCLLYLRRKHIA
ncbi:hypothetical protein [Flavihumibacter petaseus]|uniref:Glycosyltransferase RgtA/B/C/D-like domain-containing protein n=1 Tax=Flavihumibacter petaseus NBRC 106054 TaxID=1220578 RepID=A0A0E9N307_9BACT|nr:hypothetical protein [Flavihumibacter petaseus]GAO44173.1 hypothetical protein FPE01S_03_02110 [Flavihumibacter petaseus NBRC 106054]